MSIKNSSEGLVIEVTNAGNSTIYQNALPPPTNSFVDQTVAESVPSVCTGSGCVLTPGATETARGTPPIRVSMQVQVFDTAKVTVAAQAAGWVSEKLTSPGRRFEESAIQCSTDVQDYLQSTQSNYAVRAAIDSGVDCHDLYTQVDQALSDDAGAETDSKGLLSLSDKFAPNLDRDFGDFAIVRIVDRFH
jgi:hypothetical protein